MIDAHIHLDQYSDAALYLNISKWQEAGIKQVIAISTNLASAYRTLELKLKYPHFVNACIGFHPEFSQPTSTEMNEMNQLIKAEQKNLTAIGEIGLPHYESSHVANMPFFIEILNEQLSWAKKYQLPVALHAVHDKASIALSLLQKHSIQHAHFHWFKGPKDVLDAIIRSQYYVSVTPEVCYRKRDQKLVQHVPLHQLLIETDGPWQYDNLFHKQETTPLLLIDIIKCLSHLTATTEQELTHQLELNTMHCYSL